MERLKVSMITICYNAEKTIAKTIESILSQDYENLKYIIVDGGSKDHTIDITKSYKSEKSEKYKICMDYDLFARFYRGRGQNFNLSIQLLVASRMVEHRVDIRFRQSRKIYPLRKNMV